MLPVLPAVFLFALGWLQAQDTGQFPLPEDKQIQELLKAIDAYKKSGGEGSSVDPAYLLKSIERLEARLSSDSNTSDVYKLALPLLYFRIDQNSRAVQLLEDYLKGNPDSSQGRLLLAFGYLREDKFLQSQALAEKAIEIDPEQAYARHLLGLSHVGLNRLDLAVEDFEKSISLDPDFPEAHFQLGLLYSQRPEDVGRARDVLQKTLSLGLEQPDVYATLGFVLLRTGEYQEAAVQLNKAIELNPSHAQAHYLLSDAYRKLSLEDDSRAALQRFGALKAAESERTRREAQGLTHYEEGMKLLRSNDRFREAHALFQKTTEIFPNMAAAFYRLAQIELLLKRPEEALTSIRRALELDPLDPEYYFILSRCLQRYDVAGAIDAIRRAISLNPDVADFHNVLGNLSFDQGDYQNAVSAYRRATVLQSNNPAFHLNLSAALNKTGDREGSRKEKDIYNELVRARKP